MKKIPAILLGLAMSLCICTPVSAAVQEDVHECEVHVEFDKEPNQVPMDTGFACPKCKKIRPVRKRYYEPLTGTFTNIVYCKDCDLEWNVYHYYSLRNVEE